jgi:hypothetical protein
VTDNAKFPYFLMKFKNPLTGYIPSSKNPPGKTKKPTVLPTGGFIVVHTLLTRNVTTRYDRNGFAMQAANMPSQTPRC